MPNSLESNIMNSLVDNLTSGVLVEDSNRIILRANLYFTKIFDIPVPPEALKGQDCNLMGESAAMSFKDPDSFLIRVFKILKDRELILDEHVYLKNGKILERDYIPVTIDGDYRGHVWHYRDITNKILINQYLKKTADDNSYMLSKIGHEIRSPLSGIIGLADLMLMVPGELNEDQKDDLSMIQTSARNVLEISESILNKVSGNMGIPQETFILRDYISEVAKSIFPSAKKKGLHIDLENTLPALDYTGYKIHIYQIIVNIVNNAVKYTDKGSIHIKCWEEDRNIIIKITDTGKGIPEDKINAIFKAFSQIDSNMDGAGLGLHIVLDLLSCMKGDIKVESKLNIGSSFIISFPFESR